MNAYLYKVIIKNEEH